MPRRNLTPSPPRPPAVPDSLGRMRVYFDMDRTITAGLSILAAKRGTTKRALVESLIADAIKADPDVDRMAHSTPGTKPATPAGKSRT